MNCKNCGTELEDSSKFCSKCGQKVITETKPVSEQKTGKKPALVSVVSILAFIVAFGVAHYLTQQAVSLSASSPSSKAEIINQAVEQAKSSITLPDHVDAATTLTNITAEPDAIHYYYILSGINTSSFSDDYLKNYLSSGICQNKDTKNLLDQGINMEYSYTVENSTQTYFVSFTQVDCP